MRRRIVSFFMVIFTFFSSLFTGNINMYKKCYVFPELLYGDTERQELDLYIPKDCGDHVGLVLMIHGGGWVQGNKDFYEEELRVFSRDMGYAAAAMNYRYASEDVDVFGILDDISLALQKIKDTAAKKGVTIDKVLLTGISAGAHLSLLYGYTRADTAPIRPAAVVSLSGPTDLSEHGFVFENELGDASFMSNLLSLVCGQNFTPETFEEAVPALQKASPLTYVNADTVPTVICQGLKDTLVPSVAGTMLDEKLTASGVPHDLLLFPNSGHGLEYDADCTKQMWELYARYAKTYLN